MEAEKPLLTKSEVDADSIDLPQPIVSREPRRRPQVTRRAIAFSLIAFLALWFFRGSVNGTHAVTPVDENGVSNLDQAVNGYLRGVVNKGMRKALCGLNTKKEGHLKHDSKHHHKDHDGKHGHHDGKHDHHDHKGGKHGHHSPDKGGKKPGMKVITPKMAEQIFLSVPNNDSCRAASRRYTSYAHPAGSGFDYVSAINLKNEWERELGLQVSGPEENFYDAGDSQSQARIKNGMNRMGVWVDTYYPVMNTPVYSSVTLLSDPPFSARLREDIVEGDPDSIRRDDVPVFHGLSVSGDVTGKYVYVGYGRKADFELLQEKGIDVTGKIALVKYGRVFRGLKVKAAQEAGAIGCLIFTDPGDDGEMTEANGYEQYPIGPARQASSVQRGSVQFLSKYPGDPTTPGEPAYKNASRLEGGNVPSIPSLPMSYEDAIPLLKALNGTGVSAGNLSTEWVGGLGFYGVEYFTGPSEVDLHFVNEVNTRVMPIWNTMATIPGHITDEVIIFGNHRDAWVMGASDPNSGTASQYEIVRGLGKLLSMGWKPLRTIVLASWDAEEYGLIGSTEWTEDFGSFLVNDAAAYLNLDGSVSGQNFGANASPSLAWLLRGAGEEIDTGSNSSRRVWDTQTDAGDWKEWRLSALGIADDDFERFAQSGTGVGALGSGSDFTSFLQRYGVASGDMGYGGGPKTAVYHYHSVYDSFNWQDKFTDPGFHRHVDAAKVVGLALLRLSDSVVIPINTTQYSIELSYYLTKIERIAESLNVGSDLDFNNLSTSIQSLIKASTALDEEKQEAVNKLHKLLPKPKNPKHSFFGRLRCMWYSLRHKCGSRSSGDKLKQMKLWREPSVAEQLGHMEVTQSRLPKLKGMRDIKKVLLEIRGINQKLKGFEGGFITEEGLKEREWYKHKGVAPGMWLGYGATTFPALTEALTIEHSTELAQKEADELAEMISEMAKRLSA